MLDLIAKNILNGELSQKIKREGKVNIENATLSRDKQQLQIDLVTNFVIPHFALNSIMQMMEARLSRESNAPVRVNISYKVKAPIQKKAEILKFGLEYLVNSKEHEIKGFDKNLLDAIIVKSAVSDDVLLQEQGSLRCIMRYFKGYRRRDQSHLRNKSCI